MRVVKKSDVKVLEVRAALVASANPQGVDAVARLLYEMADDARRPTASLILAIFDGDVDAATYATKRAMNDDPPWVTKIFTELPQRPNRGTFPDMLVLHLLDVREAQQKEDPSCR